MTVETNARFINQLNEAYPRDKDLLKEGDDHIRLVKSILKNTFPGFSSSVQMKSDKLNRIHMAMTFDGASPVFDQDVKFATDKRLNMNNNRITNLKDPVEDTDAVSLKFVKNSIGGVAWPVGSVFLSVDDRDPSITMGFGTWQKIGGRMLVGSGIGTDASGTLKTFATGESGGFYNHKISVDELPNHNHVLGGGTSVFSSDTKIKFPGKAGDTGQLVGKIPSFTASGPCNILCRAVCHASQVSGDTTDFGVWFKVFNEHGALVGEKKSSESIMKDFSNTPTFEVAFPVSAAGKYTVECWGYNPFATGTSELNRITFTVSEANP